MACGLLFDAFRDGLLDWLAALGELFRPLAALAFDFRAFGLLEAPALAFAGDLGFAFDLVRLLLV